MTTIETAVSHRERRLSDFDAFWGTAARRAPGAPAAWAISGEGAAADALADLLVRQGVRVDTLAETAREVALASFAGAPAIDSLPPGTLIIPADQPFSRYAAALLEPDTSLPDTSLFYDITGWSLPFLYDLDAWRVEPMPRASRAGWAPPAPALPGALPEGTVALAWPYEEVADVIAAGRLAAQGVQVRVSERPFRMGDRRFPRGSFVVASRRHPGEPAGDSADLAATVREAGARPLALDSFRSDDGVDLGSGHMRRLRSPRIALASGPGTQPVSVGNAWQLLGDEAALPLDVIRLGDLVPERGADEDSLAGVERAPLDLSAYTAVVLPDAEGPTAYRAALGPEGADRLAAWVRGGGTLIAIKAAAAWLADSTTGIGDLELAPAAPPPGDAQRRAPQAVRDVEEVRSRIPGTLLAVAVDTTAALGYGYADGRAAVLVRDPIELELGEDGNAWVFATGSALAGYLPADARKRLPGRPYAVVREVGKGRVVAFADDPGFRGIMYGLKKLYLNAVLLMP